MKKKALEKQVEKNAKTIDASEQQEMSRDKHETYKR